MTLNSCTELTSTAKKLEIEVSAEEFSKACTAAFNKEAKKINVPGFRKGKAPRSVVEKMYGKEYFYDEAVNALYPKALAQAAEEAGLKLLDGGVRLDLVTVEDGKPFVFTAEIDFVPDFEIDGYCGIEIEKPAVSVTDEQVEAELTRAQKKEGRTVPVEGKKSEHGDIAVFDFEGFIDDVPFDGGKAESYELELGSGQFIPGFEEQLVGHDIGEEFDVNVNFPEEYGAAELAGKPAVFKIKLHSLKKTEYPEIDDEFAKDVSEFDTLAEYKDDIRKNLEKQAEDRAEGAVDGLLFEKLVELFNAELPECLIDSRVDYNINEFSYRLKSQGLSLEQYLGYMGSDMDSYKEQQKPQAESQVKSRLVLEYIAKKENIEISDEELEDKFAEMAEQYKMSVEDIKKAIVPEELADDMRVEKALDLVREKAVIKTVESDE